MYTECIHCGKIDGHGTRPCPKSPEGYVRRQERHAAVRRAWAEQIAANTPLPTTWKSGVAMTDELQAEIVAYGAACAERAMNEYRGTKED